MKKIILIVACAFILTGCEKKMVCTQSLTEDGMETSVKLSIKGDTKVKSVEAEMKIDTKDEALAKQYYEMMKQTEKDGMKSSVSGTIVTIEMDSDSFKEFDDELEVDLKEYSMDEAKAELEKEGYTCK